MLYTLNQLSGATIASQNYVNTQISNLVNSSPDLLNTLSELAINNDSSFSTTMTNLIATKVGLTSNNTISGSNTFSSTNTFSGSYTFSSTVTQQYVPVLQVLVQYVLSCTYSCFTLRRPYIIVRLSETSLVSLVPFIVIS